MGISEILAILQKGEHLTSKEIEERTNLSSEAIRNSIKRLLKDVSENLEYRMLTPKEKIERYGRNIGCKIRIYWLND